MTKQSSGWRDRNAPWNLSNTVLGSQRASEATARNAAILIGQTESFAGDREEDPLVVRVLEASIGDDTFSASIVVGWSSLYGLHFAYSPSSGHAVLGRSARVSVAYDYNLDVPARQPPGTPMFLQTEVSRTTQR